MTTGQSEAVADHTMIRSQQERFLWTYFANIALGLWLAASPITLGYGGNQAISDAASGVLIVLLAALALLPVLDFWGRWGVCLTGIWLLFAPLVFWTDSAAAYANDMLVGALVIGFSVLVPMMPGMAHHEAMMLPGPDVPPGWTYNPSSWWQRGPIIGIGIVSFLLARYLAAYQLGHISSARDPFFGDGTERILDSDVSRAWPISDAGLGSLSYLLEALSGFMGHVRRWRTMPWMVLMFGFLVIPLGVTSIVLVILQPVMVGTWCTICLATAALMLLMIPLAIDEVAAMLQFMVQAKREGQPLWRTFWVGGSYQKYQEADRQTAQYTCPMHPEVRSRQPGQCPKCGMALEPSREQREGADIRSPRLDSPANQMLPAMVWGVSAPWTLLLATAIGLWLMAAPDVLDSGGSAAASDHIVGALVAVVAVIAMAEVVRALRFINLGFALWLILGPWLLDGGTSLSLGNSLVAGLVLLVLSLPRGAIREGYGLFDRYVR